jgi:putative colanic acid biosynthesis acetyltransferase WcaF
MTSNHHESERPTATDIPAGSGVAPEAHRAWIDLASFSNPDYQPGRGRLVRCLWYCLSLAVFESGWVPVSRLKTWLLRLFGARIGVGLVIKPHVRIKCPWRLAIGDHCWIGQEVWIDNLADVELGSHVCVSQRTYLCTGSHDYRRRTFDLLAEPLRVEDGVWLGASCLVLGGVTVHANAVAAAGSVVTKDVAPATIVAGSPATPLKQPRPTPT